VIMGVKVIKFGDGWQESREAGPDYAPCTECGGAWYPGSTPGMGWCSHTRDCAYIAKLRVDDVAGPLQQYAEGLPTYEHADGDEELVGYISGMRDALKILHGEEPDRMGRVGGW
jgi:hypothetical protein